MTLRRVAAKRRFEVGHVLLTGVAAHAEVVLDPTLGRKTVVVPTHGVEDLLAAHALEARHGVGLRVTEHVPDVQRTRDRGWRCVDREHLVAYRATVESIEVIGGPLVGPAPVDAVQRRPFRNVRHRPERLRDRPAGRTARIRYGRNSTT